MQLQQSNPSFGMAYRIDAKSFKKFSPADMQKVKNVIKNNREALKIETKGSDVIIAGKGKSTVGFLALPENMTFREALSGLGSCIKSTLTFGLWKPSFCAKIKLSEFNGSTLLSNAKSTTEGCIKRFGDKNKAEKILGGL